MRTTRLLITSSLFCILLGCATSHHTQPAPTTPNKPSHPIVQKKKNPMEVSFYSNEKTLKAPYTVIGEAVVSKYNLRGIKRQDATIHDAMRTVAASMGGDAIIDIKGTHEAVVGKVISYQTKSGKTVV